MARARFWKGFAIGAASGAAAGLGAVFAWRAVRQQEDNSVVRLEKSVQIGRPIEEVYAAWEDIENLPRYLSVIESVTPMGERSHWIANINGRQAEWDAQLIHRQRNEELGWKSVSGPKHTGRITFSPIGPDTLVHVRMNYAPPGRLLAVVAGPSVKDRLEFAIDRALRDFKESLEHKYSSADRRATGTFGGNMSAREITAAAERPNPVDYTRPPEIKS